MGLRNGLGATRNAPAGLVKLKMDGLWFKGWVWDLCVRFSSAV